jgi:hypothetical protein
MDCVSYSQGERVSASAVAIAVAVISGSGIPLWFLNRFDKRNTEQHSANMDILTEARNDLREVKHEIRDVKEDVRDVKQNLNDHIKSHKENQDGFARRISDI